MYEFYKLFSSELIVYRNKRQVSQVVNKGVITPFIGTMQELKASTVLQR